MVSQHLFCRKEEGQQLAPGRKARRRKEKSRQRTNPNAPPSATSLADSSLTKFLILSEFIASAICLISASEKSPFAERIFGNDAGLTASVAGGSDGFGCQKAACRGRAFRYQLSVSR